MDARMIPVGEISPHPNNPRKRVDTAGILESVKANGVIQPLTLLPGSDGKGTGLCRFCDSRVRKLSTGVLSEHDDPGFRCPGSQEHAGDRYIVLAGHRRLAAAKEAELDKVPAVIRGDLADKALQMMLVENLQRSDLTVTEEAEAYAQLGLMGLEDWAIAQMVGVQKARVSKTRRVLSMSKTLQRDLDRNQITIDEALVAASAPRRARRRVEQAGSLAEARFEASKAGGDDPKVAARRARESFVKDFLATQPLRMVQDLIIREALTLWAAGSAVQVEGDSRMWVTALRGLQAHFEKERPSKKWTDFLASLGYEPTSYERSKQ